MKGIGIATICLIALFASLPSLAADEYPGKPIQLICPYAAGSSTDLVARTKTPAPIVKKLEGALEKALKYKETREKLAKMDYKVDFLGNRETQVFLDSDSKRWAPVVKKANISIK